VTVEAGKFT